MNMQGFNFTGEGVPARFLVACDEIHPLLEDVAILCTRKKLMEYVQFFAKMSKEYLKKVYINTLRDVTMYSKEELIKLRDGSDFTAWNKWTSYVTVFVVVRLLIMKKPIPMCELFCGYCRESPPKLQKCAGCKMEYYCNETCQKADRKDHKLVCASLAQKLAQTKKSNA